MSERSMMTAVSGIRNQQVQMDIIANNIANAGTVGFKRSRMTFEETFSQLLQGASRPPGNTGGVNPLQIGSGSGVGAIDIITSQGNIQSTGNLTDLAIRGDGFFVVSDGNRDFFTRSGAFQWDSDGRLILPFNGMIVQGRVADEQGSINEGSIIGNVIVPFGMVDNASATTNIDFVGNLDASSAEDTHSAAFRIFDSLGNPHTLTMKFTKDPATANAWTWQITVHDPAAIVTGGSGTVTFDENGALDTFAYDGGATALTIDPGTGADEPQIISFQMGTAGQTDGITQFASSSTLIANDQDGYTSGVLDSVGIDDRGIVTAVFTNGDSRLFAQLEMATFNNPAGLLRVGDNVFDKSSNSGDAIYGLAGTSINSTIVPGAIEMSNVDLAEEFTNMIIAQRAFQANARTITTTDELLQEVVNLKR